MGYIKRTQEPSDWAPIDQEWDNLKNQKGSDWIWSKFIEYIKVYWVHGGGGGGVPKQIN